MFLSEDDVNAGVCLRDLNISSMFLTEDDVNTGVCLRDLNISSSACFSQKMM